MFVGALRGIIILHQVLRPYYLSFLLLETKVIKPVLVVLVLLIYNLILTTFFSSLSFFSKKQKTCISMYLGLNSIVTGSNLGKYSLIDLLGHELWSIMFHDCSAKKQNTREKWEDWTL